MSELRDERQPGWWWAHNDVIDEYAKKLGVHATMTYLALCRHANRQGQAWPSTRRLSERLGMSRATIKRSLAKLALFQLLRIDPRSSGEGDSESNLYTLLPVFGGGLTASPPGLNGRSGVDSQRAQGGLTGSPEGNSVKETQKKEKGSIAHEGFDRFWDAYPRHVGNAHAVVAWNKLRPDAATLEAILSAIKWQAKSEWSETQFVPYPSTYLNGRRWEDERPDGVTSSPEAEAAFNEFIRMAGKGTA